MSGEAARAQRFDFGMVAKRWCPSVRCFPIGRGHVDDSQSKWCKGLMTSMQNVVGPLIQTIQQTIQEQQMLGCQIMRSLAEGQGTMGTPQ